MTAEPSGLQAPSGPLRLSETDVVSGLVDPTLAEAGSSIDPDGRIDPGTRPEHVTPGQDHSHPQGLWDKITTPTNG